MNYIRIVKKFFLLPADIIDLFYKKIFRINRYILNYKPTYDEDGLFTNHNCDFMKDELFKESYDLGFATGSTKGWHIHWRLHVLCFFAERAKTMGGDFIECGTNKGFTALSIINYVGFEKTDNKFYLMDTFNGLVDDYKSTNEKKTNLVNYKECYAEVKMTFSKFDNVEIVRGSIPDTLPKVKSNKISFIHIDMNCAKPEIDAGEYFWDKIIPSGVVVLDDYGYPGYLDQKKAWDDFAIRKGVQVLSIPTGQGLIIKP
jgi:O-methyltransferase